jgi:hypothetical protein
LEYEVAILNHDPDKIENCYYPSFTQENKYIYKNREDYNPMLPLYVGMDYNFRISPLPVAQVGVLPGEAVPTVNFIDALYTLHPLGLVDTINLFAERFKGHICREVHYIYDHTAISKNPLKTTFKDEVVRCLTEHGLDVIEHYTRDAPDHDVKHILIKRLHEAKGKHAVRVNEATCAQMVTSIELSPAVMSSGQTKKDKSTERDWDFPAEESTHFSDAYDMILWGLFEWELIEVDRSFAIPMGIG